MPTAGCDWNGPSQTPLVANKPLAERRMDVAGIMPEERIENCLNILRPVRLKVAVYLGTMRPASVSLGLGDCSSDLS